MYSFMATPSLRPPPQPPSYRSAATAHKGCSAGSALSPRPRFEGLGVLAGSGGIDRTFAGQPFAEDLLERIGALGR
jgi:hypothetical protein